MKGGSVKSSVLVCSFDGLLCKYKCSRVCVPFCGKCNMMHPACARFDVKRLVCPCDGLTCDSSHICVSSSRECDLGHLVCPRFVDRGF